MVGQGPTCQARHKQILTSRSKSLFPQTVSQTQWLHQQPTSKIASVPIHCLLLCISQKPYLILSPSNTRSTQNLRPPTCHQVSQCPVPCVVPHCKSIVCWQICGAHLQSHVIAGYRATGLQSQELLCSKATPGDPLSVHWPWSLHCRLRFPFQSVWQKRAPEINQKNLQKGARTWWYDQKPAWFMLGSR